MTGSRQLESLMEMSGFSETQLEVREAVGRVCEEFPDVSDEVTLVPGSSSLRPLEADVE